MPKTATCVQWEAPFLFAEPYPCSRVGMRHCSGIYKPERTASASSLFKAMRFVIVLLCAASLTVSANSFSQGVTLSANGLALKNVFTAVEQQTGFVFFYNKQLLSSAKPVTISAQNMPLTEFLQAVMNNQPLNFRIEGKTIILFRKSTAAGALPEMPAPGIAPADSTRTISGLVTSEAGEPIGGASVIIKGTFKGVSTDSKGIFSIRAATGQTLIFSAVGYEQMELRVNAGIFFTIKMVQTATAMKDQVVTGIYQRKKESFTGSSTTFTAKELKMVGNQSALQALKTLDPSFAIVENNSFGSDPNRLPDIEIRGKSSVIGLSEQYGTNPNQPLFILDGFETTLQVISDFSMDRIESITLLKDAAATAIYGSKAANGVVVVETKRPTPGRLRLSYNLNTTFSFADLSDYNLMNSEEKLEFEKQTGFLGSVDANGNFVMADADAKYNALLAEVRRGVNTYWMNEPLRFATAQRHTLFAEGGDGNLRYGVSLSYGDNQGVMKGSDRKLTNGNIRLIYRKGRLSATNSLSIDIVNATRETVPFSDFSRANPYFRKYNQVGGIDKVLNSFIYAAFYGAPIQTEVYYNPLYDLHNNNVNKSESQGFTNNFEIEWRVLNDLKARARIGINRLAIRDEIFRSPFNGEFAGTDPLRQGTYDEQNDHQLNYDGDLTLTYGKLLARKHMVNVVAGMRLNQLSAITSSYEVRGFISDDFPNAAFAFGYSDNKQATYLESKRRSASYFLNTGYAFDERYLLDATLRSDGASVFGSNRQFTTIWSMGLAWNVHKEVFFKKPSFNWMNSLRLRASIGNPGNQNFSDYISTRVYRYNNENRNPFGPSVIVQNHGNPSLKWQKTIDRNMGLDLETMKNRLRINADYFIKTTDPLLVFATLPSSAGATSVTDNMGALEQKGFTISANYTLIRHKMLTWMVNANARRLRSQYRNFGNALSTFNEKNKGVNMTRYYDGASPSDLWAVRSLGIDPATGREVFLTKDGQHTFIHNYQDEVVVGNSDPDVEGIFGSSVSWKGFSANVALRYRIGGQIFMQTLYDKVENIPNQNVGLNQDKRALHDRWQKPGDNAKFKSIKEITSNPMSSRFVEDNNILSGESISVGYENSTARWVKALRASSVTCRAYMNDIFRLSTVRNERGIDYPFARSVSLSVGVRF
ncbi:SusC/RagA family TonB-linked outer membrane protein [Niastella vici]|uniref:SusC/RagA family TonB-linked outer membrane protein n=1 Tax=Niastella vici TaxID=1703345 RepID=UPI001C1FD3E3|nr:SusC/RagA family TonB-linked outer membrane protein [Niastella vici]